MHERNMGGTGPVSDNTTSKEATTRKRQLSIFKDGSITGPLDYSDIIKFEEFLESFPTDPAKEDEFISAFTEAIKVFNEEEFISKVVARNDLIAQKVAELINQLPGQSEAVILASKLSFNDRGFHRPGAEKRIDKLTTYLKSDVEEAKREFNNKTELSVSYWDDHGKSNQLVTNLVLNGETVMNFRGDDSAIQSKIEELSGVIRKLVGFEGITPRMIIDQFNKISNDITAKYDLDRLLRPGNELEIAKFITDSMNKPEEVK